ncbi:MAG: EamA family transporter [Burkholderiaceae bacterium]
MNAVPLASTRPLGPPLLVPALLACYLIWGCTYLAIRVALPGFAPFFQMGSRFLTAGLQLMLWVVARGHALPTRREWRNAWVIGALMLGGGMGLTANASAHIGSGLVATFVAAVPMMVSAWGRLWGQRPTRLELLGMVVGLAGVLLLVQGSSFAAAPQGMACMVGATVLWSLGSVLSTAKSAQEKFKLPLAAGPAGFASEMLCGGAVLMLISLALGEPVPFSTGGPPPTQALAAWLYLVVFGSLIAFSAYLYLLAHASAALATSYAFVNPVIALFLGVVAAGEVVTAAEWISCGVVLLGVVLIFRGKTA